MDPVLTSTLAVWGSAVSTGVLLWNMWTWHQNKPQIVTKVETYENPFGDGIAFEIRNRGGRATTVEEIMLVTYREDIGGFLGFFPSYENVSACYRDTAKLPVVLQPGDVWKGSAPFSEKRPIHGFDLAKLIQDRRLFFKIRCAHTDRLLSGKVKEESIEWRV